MSNSRGSDTVESLKVFKCENCPLRHNQHSQRNCLEIERKFLVTRLPELEQACGVYVLQAYVSVNPEVRLRTEDSVRHTLTVKGDGTLIRKEYEVALSKEQFDTLWPAVGPTLEKYRYCIPYDEHIIELSIYIGALKGLVMAEVEFASEQAAEDFRPPDWLGEDVTENKRYKNKNLVGKEYTNGYFTR